MDAQSESHSRNTVSGAAGTRRALSAELIAILGVGATLGILSLAGMHGIRADMRDLRADVREMGVRLAGVEERVAGVEQRVARLEGRFDEFRDTISRGWTPRGQEEG